MAVDGACVPCTIRTEPVVAVPLESPVVLTVARVATSTTRRAAVIDCAHARIVPLAETLRVLSSALCGRNSRAGGARSPKRHGDWGRDGPNR